MAVAMAEVQVVARVAVVKVVAKVVGEVKAVAEVDLEVAAGTTQYSPCYMCVMLLLSLPSARQAALLGSHQPEMTFCCSESRARNEQAVV